VPRKKAEIDPSKIRFVGGKPVIPKKRPRRRKYNNVPTEAEGITFDSKREAMAYLALRLMERSGKISNIRTQVPYRLKVNGALVCTYVADFVYWDKVSEVEVVADAKGYRTDVYKLKKKLMAALLGINVVEL
jgi:hypothetical protein